MQCEYTREEKIYLRIILQIIGVFNFKMI